MADFISAYNITMRNEGGYSNDPKDGGGETWKGIARNKNPHWNGWPIVDKTKASLPPNTSINEALNIQTQLEPLVISFYKTGYWNCLYLDNVNCQQIANQLFDISVNNGSGTAAKFLQQSINMLRTDSLVVDCKVGPLTINVLNSLTAEEVYNKINLLRSAYYEDIIAADSSQSIYKHSWISRITPFVQKNQSTA